MSTIALVLVLQQAPNVFAAATAGNAVVIRAYLDGGGNPNVREPKRSTPSLEQNDPGGKPYSGDTLLILAVRSRNSDLVKLLLARRADPNGRGENNYTPLIEATRYRVPAMVKMLLQGGAKVDLMNDFGDTALVFAANVGQIDLAELLIRKGARLNGGTGWTPLMQAAYGYDPKMVAYLLKQGADPNYHPKGLMSPLECAIAQSNSEAIALLKKKGARGDVKKIEAEYKLKGAKAQARYAQQEAPRPALRATFTAEDGEVFNVAIKGFLAEQAKRVPGEGAKTWSVVNETRGLTIRWANDVSIDDEDKANDVSLEMRRDRDERNRKVVNLKEFRPTDPKVSTISPEELKGIARKDRWDKPYLVLDLPGYSPAHDRAVVTMSFGPTAHSAGGTILVEKTSAGWTVRWCDLRYYV